MHRPFPLGPHRPSRNAYGKYTSKPKKTNTVNPWIYVGHHGGPRRILHKHYFSIERHA